MAADSPRHSTPRMLTSSGGVRIYVETNAPNKPNPTRPVISARGIDSVRSSQPTNVPMIPSVYPKFPRSGRGSRSSTRNAHTVRARRDMLKGSKEAAEKVDMIGGGIWEVALGIAIDAG